MSLKEQTDPVKLILYHLEKDWNDDVLEKGRPRLGTGLFNQEEQLPQIIVSQGLPTAPQPSTNTSTSTLKTERP